MIARMEANEASFTDLQPGDTNTDYLSLVIEHNGQTGCCTMLRLSSLYGTTCIFFCLVLSYGQFIRPNACIAALTSIRNLGLLFLQLVKFRPTFLGLQAASKLFWHQYAPQTCIFVQMAEFSQKKTYIDMCTGSLHIGIVVWTELVVRYLMIDVCQHFLI